MSLSALSKKLNNVVLRQGNAFVHDGTAWRNLGVVADAQVSWEITKSGRDTTGREKPLTANITVQLVLKQTSATEMAAARDLMQPTGSGFRFKLTDRPSTTATAPGLEFVNVAPSVEGQINFSGEDSMLPLSFGGTVLIEDLTLDTGTVTFGA